MRATIASVPTNATDDLSEYSNTPYVSLLFCLDDRFLN